MDYNSQLTILATTLATGLGLAQVIILITQKKQTRIALIAEYRQLWAKCREHWGSMIYIGRNPGEYYQTLDEKALNNLGEKKKDHKLDAPTIWALESIQSVCGLLGEVSTRVLQGHLHVSDVYPIFGTGFLRHSNPLRQLLENNYENFDTQDEDKAHHQIRKEMQNWLIYHDGLRRRCLILIDVLWAEAARLEDLPPYDMESAADAKKTSGKRNRKRLFREVFRLNGLKKLFLAVKLRRSLRRSEYFSCWLLIGIKEKRLEVLKQNWSEMLLRNFN